MPDVVEAIEVDVEGHRIVLERLDDGTFRKPSYLTDVERDVVGTKLGRPGMAKDGHNQKFNQWREQEQRDDRPPAYTDVTAPATEAAKEWSGWGTALKPAAEHWILARKPLGAPTVAANVLRHGTGAINVDGCRINPGERVPGGGNGQASHGGRFGSHETSGSRPVVSPHTQGRWPANVCFSHSPECVEVGTKRVKGAMGGSDSASALGRMNDDAWVPKSRVRQGYADPDGCETVPAWECVEGCAVAALDRQSGERHSYGPYRPSAAVGAADGPTYAPDWKRGQGPVYADTGGASRYFYTAKASAAERTLVDGRRANHPTVKPVALMRWLIRLVCPPGGVVLDCFAGSGTTRLAALAEGFKVVLIEQNADYLEQLCGRAAQQGFDLEVAG